MSCSKVAHYRSCGLCESRIDSFVPGDDKVWCADCESYVTMKYYTKEVSIKVTVLEFADENPREIFLLALTEHVALLSKKTPEELTEVYKMDICKAIVQNHQVVKVDFDNFDSGIVRKLSVIS